MESRNRYPIPNIIFITILSLICIFYFVYFQSLISEKFTSDSFTIMQAIGNPSSVDSSYRNAAVLFKFLGITSNKSNIFLHFLAWIIFQLFLIMALRINKNNIFSTAQVLFISFFAFMYGVYFNTLSKDLVLIAFLLTFLSFYIHVDNFQHLILFIGLYAIFFRRYWIILFIFSIFIYIIKRPRIRKMMLYIIFFFILIIILYDLFNRNFITNARMDVNAIRLSDTSNAKSMIQNVLPNTNIISDIINYLYILITLIIPIQGIPSLNMIVYYLWIISLITLIVKYRNNLNRELLLLLFVYINMQALFEPDIGSAFRHQLALFPLIYYLLNDLKIKRHKL